MSYILDALQRAEAERARGGVPTLHARPLATPPPQSRLGSHQRVGLAIAVIGLVLGIAAAGWWMWPSAPGVVVAAKAPIAVPMAAPIAAPLPPAAPATVKPMVPTPPVAPPAKPKTTVPVLKTEPAVTAPSKPKATETVRAPTEISTLPTPQKPPEAKTPLPPLLAELPEATRRQIPSMTISGAVYSQNPAQRLLLVNGLVLSQGSQVAPELTVVEIRTNSSDFDFRGTRFRMAH